MSPERPDPSERRPALLVLADGEVFEGEAAGAARPVSTGEIVFNTALSGYQEVVTDPSYAGQVIAFTYPHIGNYGTTAADDEARRPFCEGIVVRDLTDRPSSWRASGSLEALLVRHGVPAITGVDTRRLTRHLRDHGAMPCALGTAAEGDLAAAARAAPGTDGRDLVSSVTTTDPYTRGEGPLRVVAYDFGVKETMLRQLGALATVTVVPAATAADEVLGLRARRRVPLQRPGRPGRARVPRSPPWPSWWGVSRCSGSASGHQILAAALGGTTYKLPFGHHGANHPVQRLAGGHVEVTSQNHNYAVEGSSRGAR